MPGVTIPVALIAMAVGAMAMFLFLRWRAR